MTPGLFDIIVISSSFEHLEKLRDRIYHEAVREGYFNLTTETKEGTERCVFVFRGLKNLNHISDLVRGYEYLNESDIYLGKVTRFEEYKAVEYAGAPTRLKVHADNGTYFDVPLEAKGYLGL